MKSALTVVACLFFLNHFAHAQSARISIRITDVNTQSPIPQVTVELVDMANHGTDYDIQKRTLLGTTDECGDFATIQPLSLAKYNSHGFVVDSTFILLLTDCLYGQRLVFYPVPEKHQEVTMAKPMLYGARVITDDSKSFIQLDLKINNAYLFTFTDYQPGVQLPNPRWDAANRVLILKANGSKMDSIYQTSYVGENYTYTDNGVSAPGFYTYFVSANALHVRQCDPVMDIITVALTQDLPDTVSYLPKYTTPCEPIVTGVEEMEIRSTVYPVPYQNNLILELTEVFDGPVTIFIRNTLGQEVYHQVLPYIEAKHEMDLSHLQPGVQILTISSGMKVKTFKIVKSE